MSNNNNTIQIEKRNNSSSSSRRVEVICNFCRKIFQVCKSKFLSAKAKFNGHLYCSKECVVKSKQGQPFYKNFYFCGKCKWIRQKDSIFKPKGTIVIRPSKKYRLKHDRHYCPKCDSQLTVKKPRRYFQKKI